MFYRDKYRDILKENVFSQEKDKDSAESSQ